MPDQNLEQMSSNDSDKRYFPRWEVEEPVFYRLDGEGESFKGTTKDISLRGACIIGGWNIEPQQKVEMTIQLSKKKAVKLNAHILWVRFKNGQPQMGVTFYNTPDHVTDSILQHAFELDKDKVLKHWFKGWSDS